MPHIQSLVPTARVLRVVALSVAALGPGIVSPVAQTTGSVPSDSVIEQWVRDNPEVIYEVVKGWERELQEREILERDLQTLAVAKDFAIGDASPVLGNPQGRLIHYVLDANCGFCRAMTPALKSVLEQRDDVAVVHRYVPFLSPSSRQAAVMASVVWMVEPGSYPTFYARLMAGGSGMVDDAFLDRLLSETVQDPDAIRDALRGRIGTIARTTIAAHYETAIEAGVSGTPTLVIEGAGTDGLLRGVATADQILSVLDGMDESQDPER